MSKKPRATKKTRAPRKSNAARLPASELEVVMNAPGMTFDRLEPTKGPDGQPIVFMFGMGVHLCDTMDPDQPPTATSSDACPFCGATLPKQPIPERTPEHGTDIIPPALARQLAENGRKRSPRR
jgi:hypothetical protein